MSTQYEFTVPPDGTIPVVLPEELRGQEVEMKIERKSRPVAIPDSESFWRKKTLEEIDAEQGGPKVCTDPDKYFGFLSDLWDSEEEIEEFLRRRKEEI